jgi:peptide-methionine (S)-S-oxide reductase
MASSQEIAILAGGCFWGMQDLLRRYPGVISKRAGYIGGDLKCNLSQSRHPCRSIGSAIRPQKRRYRKLLAFFFQR